MSVTLQVRLNGGAPQTGGVTGAIGDVVQLTAANKSTWGGAARWEIYDYPPSFTVPAGWTADSDGVFYALGNADPPAFTISGSTNWGKYGFRVTVLDGAVLTTDDATALSIPSAGGIKSIMAGEGAQFGGTRERWVKDLKNDLRALAAGSGGGSGTVTPDPDELVKRDGAGRAFATAFVGPAAAPATLLSHGSQSVNVVSPARDITLDAGRDVILDVGSTSDEIAIKAGGTTKATIVPGASTVTVATATDVGLSLAVIGTGVAQLDGAQAKISSTAGAAATLRADSGAVVIGDGGEPDALTITPNGSGGTTTIAGFQPLSISAAGAIAVKPDTRAGGTGYNAELRGGDASTAAAAGGAAQIFGGTPGAGGTPGVVAIGQGSTTLFTIQETTTFSALGSGAKSMLLVSSANLFTSITGAFNPTAGIWIGRFGSRAHETASAVRFYAEIFGSAAIASATTTNVATFATTSNRVYQVIGYLTVSNDTDNEGAAYWLRAAFKNVAGTVTQIGTTQTIAADLEDAGQAGLSAVLDFSGTDIRLRLTTDAADTVNANGVLTVYERVLA